VIKSDANVAKDLLLNCEIIMFKDLTLEEKQKLFEDHLRSYGLVAYSERNKDMTYHIKDTQYAFSLFCLTMERTEK